MRLLPQDVMSWATGKAVFNHQRRLRRRVTAAKCRVWCVSTCSHWELTLAERPFSFNGLWAPLPLFFTWKGSDDWSEVDPCSSPPLMCAGLCSRWFISASFLPGADGGCGDRGKKARPLPGAAGSRAGVGRLPAPGDAPASVAAHVAGWGVSPTLAVHSCLGSCPELNEMIDTGFLFA